MEPKIVKYHSAVIFVRDISAAKHFYIDVLEMEIDMDFGTNVGLKGGLALWQIDPQHIIPQRLGSDPLAEGKGNRFELYFESEDLAAAFERVKAGGAEFLHELHEEPWGQKTMRFFDPDRHLIEIGETLEAFVRRLHDGGMTPEQVARKSSVPLGKVSEILGGGSFSGTYGPSMIDHRPSENLTMDDANPTMDDRRWTMADCCG